MPQENSKPRKTTRKKAPPVAAPAPAPAPADDGFVGDIAPEVRERIAMFQNQTRDITHQIGQLEVRKSQLLGALNDINMQAQAMVNAEAKRLGIPDGQPWQITADGKARVVDPGTPQG